MKGHLTAKPQRIRQWLFISILVLGLLSLLVYVTYQDMQAIQKAEGKSWMATLEETDFITHE